ncbi:hypothetical protein [Roseibium album]|uniref:hypothetical protein n=1 Tax=Roseibium album TaxID=311410 RepID=UPI002490B99B|nr:hypothetical protein [Roseibium album]
MTAAPKFSLELVSKVEIRQTANLFKSMAEDYSLAIEAAEKVTKHADTFDMRRKRKALLLGNRLLMAMLEINE